MRICDPALQDALRGHLLPLLAPSNLACLRSPSRALQELVDKKTGPIWRNAAQSIIPLQSLPIKANSYAVQQRLRLHANTMKKLTEGKAGPRSSIMLHTLRLKMLPLRPVEILHPG